MTAATVIQAEPLSSHSPFVPPPRLPEAFTLVIFGATGDLAVRKLLPALHNLGKGRLLPENFAIVGVGRREKDDGAFRADVRAALGQNAADDFLASVFYQQADVTLDADMQKLAQRVQGLEEKHRLPGHRLFYLATDPAHFGPVVAGLADVGLVQRDRERPWARVVIEKPFGHDLHSARELNRDILQHLAADQVYRIDHYLGKETVQNLLAAVLAFRIQPDEGISLSFSAKRPGMQVNLAPVRFDFDYDDSFAAPLPEAYERLLLDALRGDATLFMSSAEVEAAWEYVTPVQEAWRQLPPPSLYTAGAWGPVEANRLASDRHGGWRQP